MATILVIIAIISALIFFGVSAHKTALLVAKTRMQFIEYEVAIVSYCREYGDLPPFFGNEEVVYLGEGKNSEMFVKILSGRNPSGTPLSDDDKKNLNPKGKSFHTFNANEFLLLPDGTRDTSVIADAFNNKNICIIVEDPFDKDIVISKEKFPEAVRKRVRGSGVNNAVAIFSISEDGNTVISNCLD
ncbi:MAG: hypothetical protein LBR91_00200 [Puniceicoccales bacterium]|nr:hypothetical protein [Puniceicoccales bacterium]